MERDKAKVHFVGGVFSYERGVEDGKPCDWWLYDDLVYPFPKLSASIGFDNRCRSLKRNPFRAFVHPVDRMTAVIERAGFKLFARHQTWQWSADVWARSSALT